MGHLLILCIAVIGTLRLAEGANCKDYTGAVVRKFNTTNVIGSALSDYEHQPTNQTGLEVVLDPSDYSNDCACGIVTMWQFYAWHPGTVVFYVLDGTRVVGTSSFYIGQQSEFNFFEVPLSSDMWIPIRSGYKLGFYTEGEPMITFQNTSGFSNGYYNIEQSLQGINGSVLVSGTRTTSRKYAVAAYIIESHPPMFVNAPFETTLYTHEVDTLFYTALALDLDGIDTLTYSKTSGDASFEFNVNTQELRYILPALSQASSPYLVTLQVTDGCNAAVTATITINLVNEGPSFDNLPASVNVDETQTTPMTLYTMTATDPSVTTTNLAGDTLTCTLDSTFPTGVTIFSLNTVSNGVYNIRQTGGVDYSSVKYYDLRISCQDTDRNTIYSNFQVNVVKNEPPFYNAGSGYLPNTIVVDRTPGVSIYQLDFDDPEGDIVTVVTGPSTTCGGGVTCPFSVSSTGLVTTNADLDEVGYDLEITIEDDSGKGNTVGPYILSIVTGGRPYTFNESPSLVNLPATRYVMEHTPVGTFLFKVLYQDVNPTDPLTLAKVEVSDTDVDTYFLFDTSTGIISVNSDIDFETTGVGSWTMNISIDDGTNPPETGLITFVIVNINEGITISITDKALTADETDARGAVFPDPDITATDTDQGDTMYFTMDCGEDSKYFYLDTATRQIHFAREYDMDSGLSGTANCTVTVRDKKGLSDSDNITLTINNINDNAPKFPKHNYVFFVSTTTTFFTEIANMAATDADTGSFGSTAGTLSYKFDPVNDTEDYFQIDVAGVLYVRNLTTYTHSTYVFKVTATDDAGADSLKGTCTVTVIFSGVATTTTTTTERSLVFKDDYQNYFWLLLLGGGIFATIVVIGLMIFKDPVVNEFITFKMFKLNEWCRKRPKPKEPKRTVGKLRVTVNKKDLENDPDNALPWELLAKDNEIPEINEVQERIERRIERRDRDYKNFSGLPVFERGKGGRPESGRATVHSSDNSQGRPDSESPKYATFKAPDEKEDEDGGEGQWGDLTERRVVVTPAAKTTGGENDHKGE